MKQIYQKKLGVMNFFDFINYGHKEYSLIVVKASLEESVATFIELYREALKKNCRAIK